MSPFVGQTLEKKLSLNRLACLTMSRRVCLPLFIQARGGKWYVTTTTGNKCSSDLADVACM